MDFDFSKANECQTRAALQPSGPFQKHTITRRACGPNDVVVSIAYAGICHSDIHQVREEWGKAIFPMVPGHEIVGDVIHVGDQVKNFKVGDRAGVGCMVESCRSCLPCKRGDEQYCEKGFVATYNDTYKHSHCAEFDQQSGVGTATYGGYSRFIVVNQDFVLHVPTSLDVKAVAPLLCAGITTYSPLIHYGVKANTRLAVLGLGGLGAMAVKFGIAMGAYVAVISRGTSKLDSALNELKASAFIDSTSQERMQASANCFDIILCTISAKFDLDPYLNLLDTDGQFIMVGVPPDPISFSFESIVFKRKKIAGSLIGGIRETQEMLDFCARHNIVCDYELCHADDIDKAYDRTVAGDVKYRFVIDVNTI